jgi:hypothetical protein
MPSPIIDAQLGIEQAFGQSDFGVRRSLNCAVIFPACSRTSSMRLLKTKLKS